ncbi:MAG: hypothetical protein AABW83_00635 [Nanoarchaeota archaeon]
MIKYICTNCNYISEAKKSLECDFCGNKNIEKVKSAHELLDEVDNFFG